MIASLREFDGITAAGVLARVALYLGFENPWVKPLVTNEAKVRENVLSELRDRLHIAGDDFSSEAIERLTAAIDDESDALVDGDNDAALARLAERGELASDLYEIIFPDKLKHDFGASRIEFEKLLANTTIKAPTIEQHYTRISSPNEPTMISLFLKGFRTKWPLKDFFMLVAAHRDGRILTVHQIWRINPFEIETKGLKQPVDWLKRFADTFGADVEVGGKIGHFFLFADTKVPNKVLVQPNHHRVLVSRFAQGDIGRGRELAALVVAIDLDRYIDSIDRSKLKLSDILTPLIRL